MDAKHTHTVKDVNLDPISFAEQFVLLGNDDMRFVEDHFRGARTIISTELGKDPLIKQEFRNIFKSDAQISVLPTEKGLSRIDEHHPYFVCFSVFQSGHA